MTCKIKIPQTGAAGSGITCEKDLMNADGAFEPEATEKMPGPAAKMAEIYADELLKINKMVSDSIEPKTEPANSARNYPSTVRKDIIDGRAVLREKCGDPARGCIFKAGADQKVNAEVPQ